MKHTGLMLVVLVLGWAGIPSGVLGQQTTKEREGVTVVREGAGGDVQVLTRSKEVTTTGDEKTAAKRAERVAAEPADDTPRKARVVVAPAVWQQETRRKLDRELNEKWGITDPGVFENPSYSSFLTDALVNARKFDMLEREDLKTLLKELEFGESEYVDLQKVQKIGNMIGADYVVIPEVRYCEVASENKAVPYVGTRQAVLLCKLATSVRTVDVSTGKIIAFNISETEQKARQRDESADMKRIAVLDLLGATKKESAMKEAANLVDVAYPIKVMGVSDGAVMLNRGKGAVTEGEIFNVYAAGEMMIDPDTKESLGFNEALVGKVRVTVVNNKTCQAEIVEKTEEIKKLYICRRLSNEQKVKELKTGKATAPKID